MLYHDGTGLLHGEVSFVCAAWPVGAWSSPGVACPVRRPALGDCCCCLHSNGYQHPQGLLQTPNAKGMFVCIQEVHFSIRVCSVLCSMLVTPAPEDTCERPHCCAWLYEFVIPVVLPSTGLSPHVFVQNWAVHHQQWRPVLCVWLQGGWVF